MDRILDAALEVFSQRGFRGGSLNEVATRSGYTRAGLLHHFPSKDAILVALLERRDDALGVTDLVVGSSLTLSELADQVIDGLDELLERRDLILLAHMMAAESGGDDHPAAGWVRDRDRLLRSGIAAAVQCSITVGELPEGTDPDVLASVVLGVLQGLQTQWLVDPESVDPKAGMRALRRLVLG